MEKYDANDSILKPIRYMIDNEWLEEWKGNIDIFIITTEGRTEYEFRESLRKPQPTTITIGNNNAIGNTHGIINTGEISGHLNQSGGSVIITQEAEEKLKSYGITTHDIEELKKIASTSHDKSTLVTNAMKWLSGVTATIASKGIAENIPAIIAFISHLIN